MSAMYRLKAYFGMVPADEMGDYLDEPDHPAPRRVDRWADQSDDRATHRSADRPAGHDDDPTDDRRDGPDAGWDRRGREQVRPIGSGAGRGGAGHSSGVGPTVHGALAVDRDVAVTRAPQRAEPPVLPDRRDRPPAPARITTLRPRSYNEARTIGERYRDGIPVIMNLTELDDAAAKRLVDFAAGLAFALRGSIDKVTSRVFLLTPPEVEVSADDARLIAERGRLFGDG